MSADSTTQKEEQAVTNEEVKAEKEEAKAPAKRTRRTRASKEAKDAKEETKAADKRQTAKDTKEETKAPTTKKQPAKKPELKPEIVLQYQDNAIDQGELYEKVRVDWTEGGHRMANVKSLKVYVKPEENKAYYVINDKYTGDVDLF